MKNLHQALLDFQESFMRSNPKGELKLKNGSIVNENTLTDLFKELAPYFLFGGYIEVHQRYKIYPRSIEFYFHDEVKSDLSIQDPIMYHRNEKYPNLDLPYFPLMTMNTHQSGIDITFENEELQYRASALLREYSVYDLHTSSFLHLQSKNKNPERDTRVTFIYYFLNGFPLEESGPKILWKDDKSTKVTNGTNVFDNLIQTVRLRTWNNGMNGKKTNDRKWRFTTKDNHDIRLKNQ